jgi:hypothetical protein
MKVAKSLGVDPQTFLYASMTSRNFEELRTSFGNLTPLDKDADQQVIDVLYTTWFQNRTLESQLKDLLLEKGLIITPEIASQYQGSRLDSSEYGRVRDLQSEIDRLNKFATLTESAQVSEGLLSINLSDRLQLPESTVNTILNLPPDQRGWVPLISNPESFIENLVSFWRINDESARKMYSQIISSSPDLRKVFDGVKEEIAKSGAEEYRKEMGDPERKEKTEAEIRERTEFLLSI